MGENETTTTDAGTGLDAAATVGRLGAGEKLMALGAALLIFDFLIFEIVFDEYFFFTGTLLIAALALAAIWARNNRASTWPVPYGWTLRLMGFSAAVLGIVELLEDLRNARIYGPLDFLGGVIVYAAAFLLFWGSRQISSE